MSAKPYTFDTNLLFYAIDPDAGDRHFLAMRLVTMADPFRLVILLQTLNELCSSVSRRQPRLLPTAHEIVAELAKTFSVEPSSVNDLDLAIAAHQQHGLSFWDALVWATARRAGCTLLFSEDFQDGRTLDGVTFRNPFKLSRKELDSLL